MVVFAANITEFTLALVADLLATDRCVKFSQLNKLNLSDNTILIRLALINLVRHLPDNDEVQKYKAALQRPHEFDDFLKEELGGINSAV